MTGEAYITRTIPIPRAFHNGDVTDVLKHLRYLIGEIEVLTDKLADQLAHPAAAALNYEVTVSPLGLNEVEVRVSVPLYELAAS